MSLKQPLPAEVPQGEAPPPAYSEATSSSNTHNNSQFPSTPSTSAQIPPDWQLGHLSHPLQLTNDAAPHFTESATGNAITHLTFSRERYKKLSKSCTCEYPVWDADEVKQKLKCRDEGYLVGKVFRDLNDRQVMNVRRNKLSMWRRWSVYLPTTASSDDQQLMMEVKWHWGIRPHLTATFKNRSGEGLPMVGDKKPKTSQMESEDVAVELKGDSLYNAMSITYNGILVGRMRKASLWRSAESARERWSEMSYEIEVGKGIDWRIIIALTAVLDQGAQQASYAGYGVAASSASAASASAAAAGA